MKKRTYTIDDSDVLVQVTTSRNGATTIQLEMVGQPTITMGTAQLVDLRILLEWIAKDHHLYNRQVSWREEHVKTSAAQMPMLEELTKHDLPAMGVSPQRTDETPSTRGDDDGPVCRVHLSRS